MVAINVILLSGCTGEECGGDNGIGIGNRHQHGNTRNRAPATGNHRRKVAIGRWLTRDPIGYEGGVNLYDYVGGRVLTATDASGASPVPTTAAGMYAAFTAGRGNWSGTTLDAPGKTGHPYTANMNGQFNVDKKAFANHKCPPCKEIKFVQFYIETHVTFANGTWQSDGGNWALDLHASNSPPFYAHQTPWEAGGRPVEATMWDFPGIWGGLPSYYKLFELDFMTWAVCTKGKCGPQLWSVALGPSDPSLAGDDHRLVGWSEALDRYCCGGHPCAVENTVDSLPPWRASPVDGVRLMISRIVLTLSRLAFGTTVCFWIAAAAQLILQRRYSVVGIRSGFSSIWTVYYWLLLLALAGTLAATGLNIMAGRGKAEAKFAAAALRWFSLAVLMLVGGILVYMPFFGSTR